ncbi:NAD(P)/FAD-dependent oxidoreductase [Brevibacterium yomogidense]|uniref:NAD(P)/FAD-dependent oxidoreductase n=1 Tax=Brevibacterium yomogidense TaxID=946573 RepID=UPI000B34CB21|nr:FAD-binding oxidoreductase [Brevibacterium yomogidense]
MESTGTTKTERSSADACASRTELPQRVDVIVIGGGIMGLASAYELARAGQSVLLLERSDLGCGSTSKAAGGLRSQFSDEANIRLGARSLETFVWLQEQRGHELDLLRTGYLFLLSEEEDVARFEKDVALQNSLGLRTTMLTVEEAHALSPVISTDGLIGAVFNPDDAHCTPEAAVGAFAHEARLAGAKIATKAKVTDIEVVDGAVAAVTVARASAADQHPSTGSERRIETDHIVCAAGVWSGAIGDMLGIELPIRPLKRHVAVTEPLDIDTRAMPFTIDFSTSFYFHSEGEGLLMGAPEVEDTWEFDLHTNPGWLEHLSDLIEARAPDLDDVEVRAGWAGLYEVTPDHNALIGSSPEVAGFHYACGFSGHGFLQGPAVGEVMRDLVLGREPFVDVSGLSLDRFSAGELRTELTIV